MQRCLSIHFILLLAIGAGASSCESRETPSQAGVSAQPAPPESATTPACGEGAVKCEVYDSPADAFAAVMKDEPRVLAIGEAHAQAAAPDVATATERFRTELLPALQGRASDLIVELWGPAAGCRKAVAKVAKQQKAVTKTQKERIPSEFTRLATDAKKLGITPHHLKPSCADYEAIATAGDGDVAAMLALVARLTEEDVKRLMPEGDERLVIAYGGAMHNDIAPRPGMKEWTFGPELREHTAGKYVALDLIVPEYIVDSPTWNSLPWVAHFNPSANPGKTTLFTTEPGSYVLVFPATSPAPPH